MDDKTQTQEARFEFNVKFRHPISAEELVEFEHYAERAMLYAETRMGMEIDVEDASVVRVAPVESDYDWRPWNALKAQEREQAASIERSLERGE